MSISTKVTTPSLRNLAADTDTSIATSSRVFYTRQGIDMVLRDKLAAP